MNIKMFLRYYTDNRRHLVCLPYSIENLHLMAEELRLHRRWFHNGKYPHYDLPIRRIEEIEMKSINVSPRVIIEICKGKYNE